MAAEAHNQEGGVPENFLRKQLSVAVRSIQWSYAIFWTISTKQPGVLKWGDGYYNGDIKTRKTMQPMEYNVDKLGLKRSEQLRDLYECLSLGDANQQAKRPSASLSPEDLSDAEWYYLVCMSFTFNSGNGLPGRAYSSGQHIWVCNASNASSKIFSRSLLAKSASIQTIVCFPFLGGVIELGATESVMEDLNLIQHVKTVFLDFQILSCTEKSVPSPDMDDNEDHIGTELGHDIVDSIPEEELNPQTFPLFVPSYIPQGGTGLGGNEVNELDQNIYEDVKVDSPDGCETNQFTEDSFMLEEMNGRPSQVQSWQFMDEELIHGSINSSDGISQAFLHPNKPISSIKQEIVNNNLHLQHIQEECDHTKLSSLDLGIDDLHYKKTVSSILRNYNCLTTMPCSNSGNHKSSFVSWKRRGWMNGVKPRADTPQKILKRVLFDVARMHNKGGFSLKSIKENGGLDGVVRRPEREDIGVSRLLSERRTQVNEQQFLALRSLVPSNKFDKASVIGDTIEYLKDLQRRVEELESCRGLTEDEAKARRKHPDIVERTSDNYGNNGISMNKRKASDINELELEHELDHGVFPKDSSSSSSSEINVNINEKEVVIQMHCPWRENLLLEIMDAISDLHLDAQTVQSSTGDGILTLTLNTKFKGVGLISDGTIKRAILTIIDTT